tara:strand:+ start:6481 stop:6795 length:315 start_codon:yes stop_codon:yes gene_type:complete
MSLELKLGKLKQNLNYYMKAIQQFEALQQLNKLISQQKTGSPDEIATRLKISRSHVYNLVEVLRDWGAPVKYSRRLRSFFYSEPICLSIVIDVKIVAQDVRSSE